MQTTTKPSSADLLHLDRPGVWDTDTAFQHLQSLGQAESKRTAERRLHELGLLPPELSAEQLRDAQGRPLNAVLLPWSLDKARSQRKLVLFAQWQPLPSGVPCLHANDARGGRYWVPLAPGSAPSPETLLPALAQLQQHIGKEIAVYPHGALVTALRDATPPAQVSFAPHVYAPVLQMAAKTGERSPLTPHLKHLEAESIHIIREAVAEAENPVMLYSLGKDSSVMLHLARKAFYPAPPPFPLLHVDTRWKFQEMYLFRDQVAQDSGMELLVHINPEAIEKNINPFDHGSALHTDITKTEGLKQALDQHRFDIIFGGARRDEEKSRAKERVFSFRSASHRWDLH